MLAKALYHRSVFFSFSFPFLAFLHFDLVSQIFVKLGSIWLILLLLSSLVAKVRRFTVAGEMTSLYRRDEQPLRPPDGWSC